MSSYGDNEPLRKIISIIFFGSFLVLLFLCGLRLCFIKIKNIRQNKIYILPINRNNTLPTIQSTTP